MNETAEGAALDREIPSELAGAVLCYCEEQWAYFTTQPLAEQWGDDWDDAPYEHNAGRPYVYHEHDRKCGKPPWVIIRVGWRGPWETPCGWVTNSELSVEDINSGRTPWLRPQRFGERRVPKIYAGTTLGEFAHTLLAEGGMLWLPAVWPVIPEGPAVPPDPPV